MPTQNFLMLLILLMLMMMVKLRFGLKAKLLFRL